MTSTLHSVLCVDDNKNVADAIRVKLSRAGGFTWLGWLPSADDLVQTTQGQCPAIVLLDLDMPGRDPFEAASQLSVQCPETRVVVFSGHVRGDLIDRALEAGAWGYASKGDGEEALLSVIDRVLHDEVAFSPEVRATYDGE